MAVTLNRWLRETMHHGIYDLATPYPYRNSIIVGTQKHTTLECNSVVVNLKTMVEVTKDVNDAVMQVNINY
jgi:hypothetical protein